MWSFVTRKTNKQWIWIALDADSREIVALIVGDRSESSARALWQALPQAYREHAMCYTDEWEAYAAVIPAEQHRPLKKGSGKTNHIERFNCTLRQRVSRLVRKSLSFSKSLDNHIGATPQGQWGHLVFCSPLQRLFSHLTSLSLLFQDYQI